MLLKNVKVFFGSFFIPAVIINYYLLWYEDKYLNKFKEFESESKTVKSKWAWLGFYICDRYNVIVNIKFYYFSIIKFHLAPKRSYN